MAQELDDINPDEELEAEAQVFNPGVGRLYIMREVDYLTGESNDYYKIGIVRGERDASAREREHRTGNPRAITIVSEWETPNVQAVETLLHNSFASHRVSSGEWFYLPGDLLVDVHKQAEELVEECRDQLEIRMSAHAARVSGHSQPALAPSESVAELAQSLADLVASRKEIKRYMKELTQALNDAVGDDPAFEYMYKFTDRRERVSWDLASFKKEHKDVYSEYQTVPNISWRTKWLLDGTPDDIYATLQVADDGNPHHLHECYLLAWGMDADLAWREQLSEDFLLAECGEAAALEGILEWNEFQSMKFDKARFQEEQPELFEKYWKTEPAKRTKAPAEWASYARLSDQDAD